MSYFILDNFPCSEVCHLWNSYSYFHFLLVVLLWYIFLHPFIFNLYVSLNLKCVSHRLHIIEFGFLIHSDNLYIYIGTLRPLTFNVIIGIVGLSFIIFVTLFYLLPLFLFLFLTSTLFLSFVHLIGHSVLFYFLSFHKISVVL